MRRFTLALDLSNPAGAPAIVVIETIIASRRKMRFGVIHLERLAVGRTCLEINRRLDYLLDQEPLLSGFAFLLIVIPEGGRNIYREIIRLYLGVSSRGVEIVESGAAKLEVPWYQIPRRELEVALRLALEGGQLRIAEALPGARDLIGEIVAGSGSLARSLGAALWYGRRSLLMPAVLTMEEWGKEQKMASAEKNHAAVTGQSKR
ncbi:MAG: hypothetical protein HY717_09215 [Planctomycetes bacterium]|nr:hypothetical protein [Planctomycetota bacterium]